MTIKMVSKTLTGANQWTNPAELIGYFNLAVSGTWSGTVTIQRSFNKGDTWFDVDTWIANTQEYGLEPERGIYYRAGMKSDGFTSGECVVRLSQ